MKKLAIRSRIGLALRMALGLPPLLVRQTSAAESAGDAAATIEATITNHHEQRPIAHLTDRLVSSLK